MNRLKLVIAIVAAALGGITPAFASDVDITTNVESLPASVTVSTTTQSAYVSYRITLTPYSNNTNETFDPVYFIATTTVLTGSVGTTTEPSQAAVFDSPLPAGCVLASRTTVNCTFSPGLNSAGTAPAPKIFTLVVKAPTAGGRINFTSETRWFEAVGHDNCGPAPAFPLPIPEGSQCYETEGVKATYTTLNPANPTVVDTYVPVAGGTVTTGDKQGAATCVDGNKWVTIVRVPAPALVGVNSNKKPIEDNDVPGTVTLFSKIDIPNLADLQGPPQLFGEGTRWYDRDAASKLVVNILRRDKCTIGSGNGTLNDAALILREKIYHKPDVPTLRNPDNPPVYKPLYLCLVSGGPYPGEPCIVYAQVYTRFNLPRNVTNPWDYLGDHEWVIFANENGKYFPN